MRSREKRTLVSTDTIQVKISRRRVCSPENGEVRIPHCTVEQVHLETGRGVIRSLRDEEKKGGDTIVVTERRIHDDQGSLSREPLGTAGWDNPEG